MHLKCRNSWSPDVSALNVLNDYTWQRHLAEKYRFKSIFRKKTNVSIDLRREIIALDHYSSYYYLLCLKGENC